jgi:tRNA (cmo5U34)-methyltransferase
MTSVGEIFSKSAAVYDQSRTQLVPCFDGLYGTVLEVIPFAPEEPLKVLDLGAGTGLLTLFLAEAYPNASFTLMDISEDMLAQAQSRFADQEDRFNFVLGDYRQLDLGGAYDLIVSALSIHHLSHEEKQGLFARLPAALADDGMFINADEAAADTAAISEIYRANWLTRVQRSGLDKEVIAAAVERRTFDRPAPLNEQMGWLAGAGFSEVACWFQDFGFVVYSGVKAL